MGRKNSGSLNTLSVQGNLVLRVLCAFVRDKQINSRKISASLYAIITKFFGVIVKKGDRDLCKPYHY